MWFINFFCCLVFFVSFKFFVKRLNIGRKKMWNFVVIDRFYSLVFFWYLFIINCLIFVFVLSFCWLRKVEKVMGIFFFWDYLWKSCKVCFCVFLVCLVGKWNGFWDWLVIELIFWVELWIIMIGGLREIFFYGLGEMGFLFFGEVCKLWKYLVVLF